MRRLLGILALTVSLIACGGDPGEGEDDITGAPTRSDAGTPRDASPGAPLDASMRGATTPPTGSGTQPASTPPTTSASSGIEIVVAVREYIYNINNTITTYVRLIPLFKNGWGCYNPVALNPTTNLESHRASHPKDWFKWQRSGKNFQKLDPATGKWNNIVVESSYPALARSFALSGTYSHITPAGGGTLVFGTKVDQFQFSSNLTFSAGGQRGTYVIDGYGLTLTNASGRSEVHSIVGMSGFIWIDGLNYIGK